MKKLLSILCVAALVIGMLAVTAVSAGAEIDSAKTALDVKKGDEVVYSLHLDGVKNPIIGCDFSFYYEPGVFEVDTITDFEENDKAAESLATINPKLEGEVRGNWSILAGLDFSKERNFITIKYKALKDADNTHLSYFIRYMYDESLIEDPTNKPQITDFKFTCTVTKNGEKVLDKVPPELNVEEPQKSGLFVNSVTGDSKDADASIPNTVGKTSTNGSSGNGGSGNGGSNNGGSNANVNNALDNANNVQNNNNAQNNNNGAANNADKKTVETKIVDMGKTDDGYYITATDADGNVLATSDQAPVVAVETTGSNGGGTSPIVWIIIALIVLAGGGAAAYFYTKKKKASGAVIDAPVADNTNIGDSTDSDNE